MNIELIIRARWTPIASLFAWFCNRGWLTIEARPVFSPEMEHVQGCPRAAADLLEEMNRAMGLGPGERYDFPPIPPGKVN